MGVVADMSDRYRCLRNPEKGTFIVDDKAKARDRLRCFTCAYSGTCTGPVKLPSKPRADDAAIKAALNELVPYPGGWGKTRESYYRKLFGDFGAEIKAARERAVSWRSIAEVLNGQGVACTPKSLWQNWSKLREEAEGE